MSLTKVWEFLVAAMHMTTTTLPDLFAFPHSGLRWKAVPEVEIRLVAEHDPTGQREQAMLDELIDFSPFGEGSAHRTTLMTVTIPAAPYLSGSSIEWLTKRALVDMAQRHGYLDAAIDRI